MVDRVICVINSDAVTLYELDEAEAYTLYEAKQQPPTGEEVKMRTLRRGHWRRMVVKQSGIAVLLVACVCMGVTPTAAQAVQPVFDSVRAKLLFDADVFWPRASTGDQNSGTPRSELARP